MEKILRCFLIVSLLTIVGLFYPTNIKQVNQVNAIYDPLSVPNNKIGIHILFPDEIEKASELVNSSGGDWGYTVIPIQSSDKDLKKWQNFLDSLEWPTKNRYVIVFNEVNRADEWEGKSDPADYARLLSYATIVFKSKNPDF